MRGGRTSDPDSAPVVETHSLLRSYFPLLRVSWLLPLDSLGNRLEYVNKILTYLLPSLFPPLSDPSFSILTSEMLRVRSRHGCHIGTRETPVDDWEGPTYKINNSPKRTFDGGNRSETHKHTHTQHHPHPPGPYSHTPCETHSGTPSRIGISQLRAGEGINT